MIARHVGVALRPADDSRSRGVRVTTSVSKNVVKVVALAVAALAVMPVPGANAGASGTDRQLSIDCDADALAGGEVTYDVVVNAGDTISIENLGGCDAHMFNSALVSEVTPPGNPTIVYQVVDPLAAGSYSGEVGNLGSEWPIVLGTVPQPTSWISLTVVETSTAFTPEVTLKGPGKAVKAGSTVTLKGSVSYPEVRVAAKISEPRVKLFKKTDSGWKAVDGTRTSGWAFSFDISVNKNTRYQARTVAQPGINVGRSEVVRVEVAKSPEPAPDKTVDVSVSRKTVKQGNEIVVSSSCGKGCADRQVTLQKRVGGEWKMFAQTRMNDLGRHNFKWDTVTLGTYKMRVVVKNWAKSKTVTFDVVR